MQTMIYVDADYEKNFIRVFLPEVFTHMLKESRYKNDCVSVIDYIEKNYDITWEDFCKCLCRNMQPYRRGNHIELYPNTAAYVNKNTKLGKLLQLLQYGNLEVKGTNMLKTVVQKINANISILYFLYCNQKKF